MKIRGISQKYGRCFKWACSPAKLLMGTKYAKSLGERSRKWIVYYNNICKFSLMKSFKYHEMIYAEAFLLLL